MKTQCFLSNDLEIYGIVALKVKDGHIFMTSAVILGKFRTPALFPFLLFLLLPLVRAAAFRYARRGGPHSLDTGSDFLSVSGLGLS
jgi:hypothetical protein